MVRAIRPDGRLDLVPIGTWSARFAEGGRVTVFTEEPDGILTGTPLPCKASGHAFGDEIDEPQTCGHTLAVRLHVPVTYPQSHATLRVRVGCLGAVIRPPVGTDCALVVSRHIHHHTDIDRGMSAAQRTTP